MEYNPIVEILNNLKEDDKKMLMSYITDGRINNQYIVKSMDQ